MPGGRVLPLPNPYPDGGALGGVAGPTSPAAELAPRRRWRVRRGRRRRFALLFASVAAASAVSLLLLWEIGIVPPIVFISGCGSPSEVPINFSYTGPRQGYFWQANVSTPPWATPCGTAREQAGGAFVETEWLYNSDRSSSHLLNGASVPSPWRSTGASPAFPAVVGAGAHLELNLSMVYPDQPGGHFGYPVVTVYSSG